MKHKRKLQRSGFEPLSTKGVTLTLVVRPLIKIFFMCVFPKRSFDLDKIVLIKKKKGIFL